jgi:hypothetical protein
LEHPVGQEPAILFAMDAQRRRGGLIAVKDGASVRITIRPLVSVRGRCASTELTWLPRRIGGAVIHASGRQFIDWRVDGETGIFELPLPPGEYRLVVMSEDARTSKKDIKVEENTARLDLRVIDLQASIIARHYGKKPPASWRVTAARGVDRDVKLSDYRGRWVLLEFWGFW